MTQQSVFTNTPMNDAFVDGSGRFVVAGINSAGTPTPTAFVTRFLSGGGVDTSFGVGGATQFNASNGGIPVGTFLRGAAEQSDGKIVVTGLATRSPQRLFVARLLANGLMDVAGFGFQDGVPDGITVAPFSNANGDEIVIDSQDRILIAGVVNQLPAVVRYLPDGVLDTTFGVNGVRNIQIGQGGGGTSWDLELLADGSIILGGHLETLASPTGSDVLFAKLTANGAIDTSFGVNGVKLVPIGPANTFDIAFALSVHPDGRIVGAGSTRVSGQEVWSVVRITAQGQLDTSFDGDGIVISQLPPASVAVGRAMDVLADGDGGVLVSGFTARSGGGINATLIRYTTTGQPDAGFGSNGVATFRVGVSAIASSLVRLSDGRVAWAGDGGLFTNPNDGTTRATVAVICYAVAGLQPPVLTLTSPAEGAIADQSVLVAGSVESFGLQRIEIAIDNVVVETLPPQSPFSHNLDLTGVSEGGHTLTVTAVDSANQTDSESRHITVDHQPPTVAITAPAGGDYVKGTITIQADASDTATEIEAVDFYANGQLIHTDLMAPYDTTLDTTQYQDGPLELYAVATDGAHHTTQSATVTVTVDNTAPAASITSPADGTTLSGDAQVTIQVNDTNLDTARVLLVRGTDEFEVGSTTSTGETTFTVDTREFENGDYTLKLVATDRSGNSATDTRSISILNIVPVLGQEEWLSSTGVALGLVVGHASGNLTTTSTDVSTSGLGIQMLVTRSYNHQDTTSTGYGPGWRASFDRKVHVRLDGAAVYTDADGTRHVFPSDGHGGFGAATGLAAELAQSQDGFVLTRLSGDREIYDEDGLLVADETPNGNRLTVQRDAASKVTELRDDSGLAITVAYNADDLVESVTDQLGRATTYTYASGHLASAADPEGGITRYEYDAQGRLSSLTDPASRTISISYDEAGRVERTVDGENTKTSFTYQNGEVTVSVDDPRVWTYSLDGKGRASETTDPSGGTTSQIFDGQGFVTSYTNESGDTTSYTYTSRGALTSQTDFNGKTTTYSDLNQYGEPGKVTDPLGHVTRYEYNPAGNTTKITTPRGGETTYNYDSNGNQTSTTDALGNTTTSTYDTHGNLTKTERPEGATTTYTVDAAGQVTSEIDPNGNATTYAYDDAGRQTSIVDPEGGVRSTTFNAAGDVTAEKDARGSETTYSYDGAGRQTKMTDPLGGETKYAYNPFGEQTSVSDPNGHATTLQYNARSDLVKETDPLGRETLYTTDPQGRITSVTDPAGFTTGSSYDANGNLTQTTQPDGSTILYTYNGDNTLAATTDANGHTTSNAYDADRNQVGTTDPLGHTTSKSFDLNDWQTGTTDPTGAHTAYTLDGLGRTTRSDLPDGTHTTTSYDPAGNETGQTDQLGHTTTMSYDKLNRLTASTDPSGGIIRYAYDANGNLTSQTDPLGKVTTYQYDANNRLTNQTDPAGSTTGYSYDPAGNLTSQADGAGKTTTYTFDAANQPTSETDPNGLTTHFTYDGRGLLASETDAANRTTSYTYDELGRPRTITDPDGKTTTTDYDSAGNLLTRTDASGVTTSYQYDAANRLTQESSPLEGSTSYAYNERGDLTSTTTPAGTTTYTVDSMGRVTGVSYPGGASESYSFDAAGNITSRSDNSGTTSYEYDASNRVTQEVQPGGVTINYTYDRQSQILSISVDGVQTNQTYRDNGLYASQTTTAGTVSYTYTPRNQLASVTTPGGQTTTFSYDNAARLAQIIDTATGHLDYGYDAANRITSLGTASGANSYTYDVRGQLTSWTITGVKTIYNYDPHGNLTSLVRTVTNAPKGPNPKGTDKQIADCLIAGKKCTNTDIATPLAQLMATIPTVDPSKLTGIAAQVARYLAANPATLRTMTYNTNNQLVNLAEPYTGLSQAFAYDAQGNQTSAGGLARTFDSQNRLTSVQTPPGIVTYVYNAKGLKSKRTIGASTDKYFYDKSDHLVKEVKANGDVVNYSWDQQGLRSIRIGSASYFPHYNHRGDVLKLTDASGAVKVSYSYTPWGEAVASGDAGVLAANRFMYNGRDGVEHDPASGLYWMRARWYSAEQARFLSVDPMPSHGGTADTDYGYAANDPIGQTDPSGSVDVTTKCLLFSTTFNFNFFRQPYFKSKARPYNGSRGCALTACIFEGYLNVVACDAFTMAIADRSLSAVSNYTCRPGRWYDTIVGGTYYQITGSGSPIHPLVPWVSRKIWC